LPLSLALSGHYAPTVGQSFVSPQTSATGKGRGGIPLESVTSNRIYLWSKRFGAILLIAMAIVAAGNAQQSSTNEKANPQNHL
jgi:hypothetical protein